MYLLLLKWKMLTYRDAYEYAKSNDYCEQYPGNFLVIHSTINKGIIIKNNKKDNSIIETGWLRKQTMKNMQEICTVLLQIHCK